MTLRILALAICGAMLLGCAAPPRLAPIRGGSPVAFVVTTPAPGAGDITIRETTVVDDARIGASSGVLAGALYGLTCGPWFIVCSPLGALLGGGVGGLAGATVGLAESLPPDVKAQLSDRLARLRQSHDPVLELRSNVVERARRHWELTDETSRTAGTVVTLEVQKLFLTFARERDVALVMHVLVSVRSGALQPAPSSNPKLFVHVASASPLAVWLDERSDVAETSLRSAAQQIAAQIVSELALN